VVARLLAGCDRGTTGGRRDYAILIMLARLGLRGAEVADLELATSTGAGARWPSAARATGSIGSRCQWMSVKPWPHI
jgi:hypothetical protein